MTSLSVVSYIERINRMYRLIRKESTGSRAELAGRIRKIGRASCRERV